MAEGERSIIGREDDEVTWAWGRPVSGRGRNEGVRKDREGERESGWAAGPDWAKRPEAVCCSFFSPLFFFFFYFCFLHNFGFKDSN